MMVPAAILLVLVLAEVVPDLALVLIVPLLAPLAVLAARWDTEALERMPVVPLDAVSPAESGVRTHHRLVPAETGEVVRYRSVTWSLLIVRRCLAVGVELRWDEVVSVTRCARTGCHGVISHAEA